MRRLLAAALLAAQAVAGQFFEVQVDAATQQGRIQPLFGIDAPSDERQARALLERGVAAPVRVGPGAAFRAELVAGLESAWAEDVERRGYDGSSSSAPAVWASQAKGDGPEAAIATLSEALRIAAPAAWLERERWFTDSGGAVVVLPALELASRLAETPRRLELSAAEEGVAGVAGVSEDGETVQVLLLRGSGRADAPPPVFALFVRNLPWGQSEFMIERYRLDADHEGQRIAGGAGRGGMARVTARFEGPAAELVVLRKAAGPVRPSVTRSRKRSP